MPRMTGLEREHSKLPPPWDRIFSLGTRTFVWALALGILYILRPFFLMVFLTFLFAYIQAHGVDGLAQRISRKSCACAEGRTNSARRSLLSPTNPSTSCFPTAC